MATSQDNPPIRSRISKIEGVHIITEGWEPNRQYDIYLNGPSIAHIENHNPASHQTQETLDARDCSLGPSLCHAHIHLDKCFLLTDERYADLEIVQGDFAEALEITSKAKERFERDDLLRRGRWLINESIAAGVTHMRAFVEVDHIVEFKCLDAAIDLKELYTGCCAIQICAFAQEPIFSGPHAERNRELLAAALSSHKEVEVLGSTPYVEDGSKNIRRNIEWTHEAAAQRGKHLDFHLDYNLDSATTTWTEDVLDLVTGQWGSSPAGATDKTVVLGHCTRLSLNTPEQWKTISQRISRAHLPLSFIGLPTSDLYMMGKPPANAPDEQRVRGTLPIPQMIQKYDIPAAIAINNVGNAFTPQGSCDPLSVASMGIGLYHAGTKADAQLLYECVSGRAKAAVGFCERKGQREELKVGGRADFVVFGRGGLRGRETRSVQGIVRDPPGKRKTVFGGIMVEV